MAITVEITDGVTTFDLVYDAGSQPNYHARKGLRVTSEETDVLQHQPDNDSPVPVRGIDRDRTVFLTKDVFGSTMDEVLNKVAEIKRFIDGRDQQALRYWTDGDVNRVDLKIQLENATNYTLNPIKWGHVDDSGAYYTAASQNSEYALGILVTLHLTPYGEGAQITLRNDLAVSPHFLEMFSGGLAAGWSTVGTPTTTINTTSWLIGGQSQFISVDNSTAEGIRSDSVTASTSTEAVAYAWVRAASATTDILTIQLTDGGINNIQSKSFNPTNPSGYDKTATGPLGDTWYRYVVSGTNSTAADFVLRVYRASGDATATGGYFIDGAYLQTGTTTAPDAWCSTSAIQNRYDPTGTSASTEARINYIDVWGVPGDTDALVSQVLTRSSGSGSIDTTIIGRQSDNSGLAADAPHWVDSADMTLLILSGSQSTTSDATRLGGSYIRHTADASSVDNASLRIDIGATAAEFFAYAQMPHRVFLVARSSSTATTFALASSRFSTVSGSGGLDVANTWSLIDIGYSTAGNPTLVDSQGDTGQMVITVTPGATSATVDIDAILLMPAMANGYSVVGSSPIALSLFAADRVAYSEDNYQAVSALGEIWQIPSGNKMSRYIYAWLGYFGGSTFVTGDIIGVTLTVTPRTRHLMGTS